MNNMNLNDIIVSKIELFDQHFNMQIQLIDEEYSGVTADLSELKDGIKKLFSLKASKLENLNEKSVYSLFTKYLEEVSHFTSQMLKDLIDIHLKTLKHMSNVKDEISKLEHPEIEVEE